MADLVGQSFAGCEIIAKLGQGGFGAVYKARQTELNRFVAIKILSRELSEDPEYVGRFKQEAALAAGLVHSGIVQVHNAGSTEGVHFFVMEFVDGESVQRRIDREGKFTPTEAVAICIYVAEALDFAWKQAKLIHRDIKPDNIFLSSRAEVKLGDLGLAKQAGASTGLTRSGMMMGTPNYISPEQAQAKKEIDFRADIYSLGCSLYHMVTGHLPYEGAGDALAIIHKHVYDPPPAIFTVWPTCPMPLAMLIGKMVAKQPRERFQSYDELIAEMRRVYGKLEEAARLAAQAQSRPPVPPQPAMVAQAAKPPMPKQAKSRVQSRVPRAGIAAGAVALVVLLAGLFLWSPWKKPGSAGVSPAEARRVEQERAKAGGTPALPGVILAPAETRVSALTTNPKVGEVFTLTLGSNVTMELMGIPRGEFLLGSTKEEQEWAIGRGFDNHVKNEGGPPRKAVIKQGFWLGRTEVTVGQWKQFVSATGYVTDGEKTGGSFTIQSSNKKWEAVKGANWKDPNFGFKLKDDHPVSCISWNDAVAFCKWLGEREQKGGRLPAGYKIRLPTEAEWEYACRAGTQTKYWFGVGFPQDRRYPWNGFGDKDGFEFVSPVDYYGLPGRNKFGLADMLGNVYEWCLDTFDKTQAHEECWNQGDATHRVLRGGSFKDPGIARCAHRRSGRRTSPESYNGFRVLVGPER